VEIVPIQRADLHLDGANAADVPMGEQQRQKLGFTALFFAKEGLELRADENKHKLRMLCFAGTFRVPISAIAYFPGFLHNAMREQQRKQLCFVAVLPAEADLNRGAGKQELLAPLVLLGRT
jgi:hypothetical protein